MEKLLNLAMNAGEAMLGGTLLMSIENPEIIRVEYALWNRLSIIWPNSKSPFHGETE